MKQFDPNEASSPSPKHSQSEGQEEIKLLKEALLREKSVRIDAERKQGAGTGPLMVPAHGEPEPGEPKHGQPVESTGPSRADRWRLAIEGSGDGLLEIRLKEGAVDGSNSLVELLGLRAHELETNLPVWIERIHPEDRRSFQRMLEDYSDGLCSSHRIEYRLMHRNGRYRWMLHRGTAMDSDDAGRALTIIGTLMPIDHIKQTERRLEESNDRLSTLILNMQTAILLEDPHRRVILANMSFCAMFAFPMHYENLIGRDAAGVMAKVAQFAKDPEGFMERVEELISSPQLGPEELLELADGRVLERYFVPIEQNGTHMGHLWKYVDVTSRVRAQQALQREKEKFRRIIANMNLGLLEVDNDQRIRYANHSFTLLSGYPMEELIGQVASQIIQQVTPPRLLDEKNGLRAKGISDAYEINIKDREGNERWWLISGAPLYNELGAHDGSIGIHLDITQRKRLESQLRQAKNDAVALGNAKEQFLAHMSHEIRTPMNAIMGLSQELLGTPLNKWQQQLITSMGIASESLMVIINDILDSSKIDAGKLDLEVVGFRPIQTLDHVRSILGHRASEKNLNLITEISPDVAPILRGDPHRLDQVLFNLVGNALKFTREGNVRLSISTERMEDDVQHLLFIVADTGIGMTPDFLQKVFEPYSQERVQIGGTGLGMPISKRLVELMGGRLSMSSTYGMGTVVEVRIPFPIGTDEDLVTTQNKQMDTTPLHGLRILLVEDNELNRFLVRTILERYAAIVVEAHNGSEAVNATQGGAFDLVLMDVHMPVMDGLEATRIIRKGPLRDLPIIGLTANVLRKELDKCVTEGMNTILTKPFIEADLIRAILSLVPGRILPASKLFDLSKINAIARGDTAFVQHMVCLFKDQTPETLTEMDAALAEKGVERLAELAHRFRSSVDAMGITQSHGVLRDIEKLGRSGGSLHTLRELVGKLHEQMREVLEQLEAHS
jgi:two-component system, sensor histidine kinase